MIHNAPEWDKAFYGAGLRQCSLPLTVSLNREGSFHVNCVGDDSTQCGIRGSTRTLFYKVFIRGREDCLTPEGFIIDNNDVQKYFEETYQHCDVETFPSCETMACRAVRSFHGMFGQGQLANVKVNHIRVSISGNPQAVNPTAEWQDGTNTQ